MGRATTPKGTESESPKENCARNAFTWKFGVHRDVAVLVDDFADHYELLFQIVTPHIPNPALLVRTLLMMHLL